MISNPILIVLKNIVSSTRRNDVVMIKANRCTWVAIWKNGRKYNNLKVMIDKEKIMFEAYQAWE